MFQNTYSLCLANKLEYETQQTLTQVIYFGIKYILCHGLCHILSIQNVKKKKKIPLQDKQVYVRAGETHTLCFCYKVT